MSEPGSEGYTFKPEVTKEEVLNAVRKNVKIITTNSAQAFAMLKTEAARINGTQMRPVVDIEISASFDSNDALKKLQQQFGISINTSLEETMKKLQNQHMLFAISVTKDVDTMQEEEQEKLRSQVDLLGHLLSPLEQKIAAAKVIIYNDTTLTTGSLIKGSNTSVNKAQIPQAA